MCFLSVVQCSCNCRPTMNAEKIIILGFWWWWWIHPPLVLESYDRRSHTHYPISLSCVPLLIHHHLWKSFIIMILSKPSTYSANHEFGSSNLQLYFGWISITSLRYMISHWDTFPSPGWYRNLAHACHAFNNFRYHNTCLKTDCLYNPLSIRKIRKIKNK